MRCLHCKTKIGLVRRLVDRQFCSDDHRRKARRVYSARLARDWAHEEMFEDGWIVHANAPIKRKSTFGPGSGVLAVVLAAVLVMFLPSGPQQPLPPSGSYTPPVAGLRDKLRGMLPSRGALSLREDFRADLRNWQGALDELGSDWEKAGRAVRIGELRLWKPTLALADYNMEFAAQIETRSVGWAFRASDINNYYAAKIYVQAGHAASRAEIVRYVVMGGKQVSRVTLPIPVAIQENTVYEVRMRVRGDRFVTELNGQTVDAWSDRRFRKGGVGFFNEPGEKAVLQWVAISEKEGFFQRFLSFSFLVHPGLAVSER